jgi:hypothetical protein
MVVTKDVMPEQVWMEDHFGPLAKGSPEDEKADIEQAIQVLPPPATARASTAHHHVTIVSSS